jgi:hypothetical protein
MVAMTTVVLCPRCTQMLPNGALFCRRCGMPIVGSIAPVRTQPVQTRPAPPNSGAGVLWAIVLAGLVAGGLTVLLNSRMTTTPAAIRTVPAQQSSPTVAPLPFNSPAVTATPESPVQVVPVFPPVYQQLPRPVYPPSQQAPYRTEQDHSRRGVERH